MIDTFIYGTFSVLVVAAMGLQAIALRTRSQISSGNNPQFKKFQHSFFIVYFMALFSDWLQGPYVYKLYSYYGYASSQIALLYVVGFASSGIFGTLIGPVTDKFGRRKMAVAFCILYSFCCLTKLSPNFHWLFLGRVLGGISTSMLFSTFESWYVHEHSEVHDFPSEWISVTFSKSTFWNGVLAINAGIFANIFAETLNFGPVSPFMLSIPFLAAAGILITKTWDENYGNQKLNIRYSCMEGLRTILFQEKIFFLGITQSLFEANMYIFVFQWTPILDQGKTPLGIIFSCFMVCIMMGSGVYSILLSRNYSSDRILIFSIVISIVSMVVVSFTSADDQYIFISFFAFLLLEIAVGMYFPAIGYLRSQTIPEELRAGIMNWFRLPMNIITCGGLLLLHNNSLIGTSPSMFGICSIMLAIALICSVKFSSLHKLESEGLQEKLLQSDAM